MSSLDTPSTNATSPSHQAATASPDTPPHPTPPNDCDESYDSWANESTDSWPSPWPSDASALEAGSPSTPTPASLPPVSSDNNDAESYDSWANESADSWPSDWPSNASASGAGSPSTPTPTPVPSVSSDDSDAVSATSRADDSADSRHRATPPLVADRPASPVPAAPARNLGDRDSTDSVDSWADVPAEPWPYDCEAPSGGRPWIRSRMITPEGHLEERQVQTRDGLVCEDPEEEEEGRWMTRSQRGRFRAVVWQVVCFTVVWVMVICWGAWKVQESPVRR